MHRSRGGDRESGTSLKNQKNIGFPSNTGPDPLKSQSYQARIQCRAIFGIANDGPLIVIGIWILPKKQQLKVGPWTPSEKNNLDPGMELVH